MQDMKHVYERILPIERFNSIFGHSVTFLRSASQEERNQILSKEIYYEDSVVINYDMTSTTISTTNSAIIDIADVNYNGCTTTYNPLNPSVLSGLIHDIMKQTDCLFIDITCISVRLLGMLLATIKQYMKSELNHAKKVFCGYTEPFEYPKYNLKKMFGSVRDTPDNEIKSTSDARRFSLYEKFAPIEPIPNLSSIGSNEEGEQVWIVLLGFEGERPNLILNELSKVDNIVTLLTVPPIRPGWNNYAFDENAFFLEGVDNIKPEIKYVPAVSPFSVYNHLVDFQNEMPSSRLLISPLGTKATSLGALLYAINNEYSSLVYDNPYESSKNSSDSHGESYIFDITEALRISI